MKSILSTPGLWEVRVAGVQSQGGDAGTFVARVNAGLVARCMTNLPNMSPAECLTEAQANARLIATAPELLTIVLALGEWFDQNGYNGNGPSGCSLLFDDDETLGKHIRTAIAKVRGEG